MSDARRRISLVLAVAALLSLAAGLHAQVTTGTILGTVRDRRGRPCPGRRLP